MKDKDSFFEELDEKKEKKTITVKAVLVFLIIVLLAIELVIFLLARSFKNVEFDFKGEATKINPFSMTTEQVEINTVSEVVISEKMLCEQIYKIYNSKNISCSINREGVFVYGKLSGVMPANANIKIMPKVEENKLKLEVQEVRFGKFVAPQLIKTSLQKGIIAKLEKVLCPEALKLNSIDLSDDLMILSGSVSEESK